MCGGSYTAQFLGDCIRGRKLVPLETAVRMLTDAPARLFGLADRGRLSPGAYADIVVFDPETITDLASYRHSTHPSGGIRHVLVNGTFVVRDGDIAADARPGRPVRADPR